jgi:hypothetical protein
MENTEVLAGVLLERLGVRGKPDLPAIAGKLGIRIREVDSEGFDGALVRAPGRRGGIIAVKASLAETARKRFTIAHLLAHFVLPGPERLNVCSANTIETWDATLAMPEIEANEFAVELLLPTKYVRSMLVQPFPDFRAIRRTAGEYETSLTATVRKFMRLTEHACAMVWSTAGHIVWSSRSEAFTLHLRRGKLSPSTRASELFVTNSQDEEPDFQDRPADSWLKPHKNRGVTRIKDCSVLLRNYDSVLTLLWIEDLHALAIQADEALEHVAQEETKGSAKG